MVLQNYSALGYCKIGMLLKLVDSEFATIKRKD